jgi:Cyclic nucleotide-binding domain
MLPLLTDYEKKMFTFLAAPYPLQEGLIEELSGLSDFRELRPKEFLLKPGETCENLYFIHQGLIRCYYVLPPKKKDGEEQEVCTWFLRENDCGVSVHSYYTQTPGKEFMQALEPCKISFINYKNLEKAYLKFMNFNYNGRLFTTKYLIELADQLKNIRLLKGAERFAELVKRDPELLRRVPQKYLASYLGVTPTSLSRMLRIERDRKK